MMTTVVAPTDRVEELSPGPALSRGPVNPLADLIHDDPGD